MLVHQTGPHPNFWHTNWVKCHKSWDNHYKIKFWTDDDLNILIANEFSKYKETYFNLPAHILQIDFARYCLLYEYGGIYADLDMYLYRPFEHKLKSKFAIVESVLSENDKEVVQNSLMYCEKKNPLMKELIEMSFERLQNVSKDFLKGKKKNANETLYLTGPVLLSDFYRGHTDEIKLLKAKKFNNLFGSYSNKFYTKHLNTVTWGKEMVKLQSLEDVHYHIFNGHLMITGRPFPNEEIVDTLKRFFTYECVPVEDFDYHKDYANGVRIGGTILPEDKYQLKTRLERILFEFGIALFNT